MYFLLWAFGFPFVVLGFEYLWVRVLMYESLLLGSDILKVVLGGLWITGIIELFRLHDIRTKFLAQEKAASKPNTILIIEAPDANQFVATDAECIERRVYYKEPPTGSLPLLLSEGNGGYPRIFATVIEVGEVVDSSEWDCLFVVVLVLHNPEDFQILLRDFGWTRAGGDRQELPAAPQT